MRCSDLIGFRVQRLNPALHRDARTLPVWHGFGAFVTHGFEDDRSGHAIGETAKVIAMVGVERGCRKVTFDGDQPGLICGNADFSFRVTPGQFDLWNADLGRAQVAHDGHVHSVTDNVDAALSQPAEEGARQPARLRESTSSAPRRARRMAVRACRGLRRFPALTETEARGEGFEPPSRSTPAFKAGALPGYAIHA